MEETQAKYHHLIPQTYMSSWANEAGTLQIEFLNNPGVFKPRNKENIAGITDYHSIKAGMVICTKDDADKIFFPLTDYTVEIDGQIVTDTLELNQKYYDFDSWTIRRRDGSLVSKKGIKREIEKIKIKDIESNWSTKYESKWNTVVTDLESILSTSKSESVIAIHKDYLMKFFVALDWRSIQSNDEFQKAFRPFADALLDEIEIPEEERILPCLKTAADEMKHNLLLKYYRKYLNDDGVIYTHAMASLKHTNFHFLIADGPTYFDTSDNPSFIYNRNDGLKEGLMPMTPLILMEQGKCIEDADKYFITHISDDAVKKYNKIIRANANEFVIHPDMAMISGNK